MCNGCGYHRVVTARECVVLQRLLGDGVVAREADPAALGPSARVYEEERRAVERAVDKRRYEYWSARHLARQALAVLGIEAGPLLNAPDRSPIWPPGVIGSISHTTGWCGVAVAHQSAQRRGLGIDAERCGKMSWGVAERVLTPRELARLPAAPHELDWATLLFSAKEAVYKCIYPSVRRFVGFLEVELELDVSQRTFRAIAVDSALAASEFWSAHRIEGCWMRGGDLWLTAVTAAQKEAGE